jgi:hypothetical protein
MFHFMASYAIVFTLYTSTLIRFAHHSVSSALLKTVIAAVSFNTTTLLSIVIYRIFFHRIRKFPGPFAAQISRFHATYIRAKHGNYYVALKAMHEKYGDFVRTGPREISIVRKEALALVYGPRSKCRKSTWYGQSGEDARKVSMNMTRDRALFKLRRKAWDRGLSVKCKSQVS